METEKLKRMIVKLQEMQEYKELDAYFSASTIFSILQIERSETKHSAFIAWLLDPNGSHGLGDKPLRRFMKMLAINSDTKAMTAELQSIFVSENYSSIGNVVVDVEHLVDGMTKGDKRIDIFMTFDVAFKDLQESSNDKKRKNLVDVERSVALIVENKIYSEESENQTKTYYDWAKAKYKDDNREIIGVFLTPTKRRYCSADSDVHTFVKISYQEILHEFVEYFIDECTSEKTKNILDDFVKNLCQPWGSREDDKNEEYILATPKVLGDKFEKILDSKYRVDDSKIYTYKNLILASAYYANTDDDKNLSQVRSKKIKECTDFLHDDFKDIDEDGKQMLINLWYRNHGLFTSMIINSTKYAEVMDTHNNTYWVKRDDTGCHLNGNKPVAASMASYFALKAWIEMRKEKGIATSLNDLRENFPIFEARGKEYNDNRFLYMFYKIVDGKIDIDDDEEERLGKQLRPVKYIDWYFYQPTTKYILETTDGSVLNMKYWEGDTFETFIPFIKKYGISIEKDNKKL